MKEEMQFKSVEDYQNFLKERQELLAYCKKIGQGIDNLDEKSGERAIWELVQNARDMDENCRIRIELLEDRLIFSHHGKPFDYMSLLALVNQNSSKDNPGADLVGKYGTGFMTTHAFNNIVTVDGPYKVMIDPKTIEGYVELGGLVLNRSFCCQTDDLEEAIVEMRNEMRLVDEMYKKTPLLSELPDKWTSFTYLLERDTAEAVSHYIDRTIRFMPFVLSINSRIKEVEVIDIHQSKHSKISKSLNQNVSNLGEDDKWQIVDDEIIYTYFDNTEPKRAKVKSIQSKDRKDIVILPPYPLESGQVSTIPSLFLWFPLLGTESFGVNFIFHSSRFHPVEKSNNILLPENVPSKLNKGLQNETVLNEMMSALFNYFSIEGNDAVLSREMCSVKFHRDLEDKETLGFYNRMQDLWKSKIPAWKVIPTKEGKKAMNEKRVRVLHPDFYQKLTEDKRKIYEPTLIYFTESVIYYDQVTYLLPTDELIAWSETINQWSCKRDSEFYITVKDVCKSIKSKTDKLHEFLSFLVDSGNSNLLDEHEIVPNRRGTLCKKGDLRHGDFMTDNLYELSELLMGNDARRMIDTSYTDIVKASTYKPEDLQRAISQTIIYWRNCALSGQNNQYTLKEETLNALIKFCSATSQADFTNYRGRMMKHIVKIYGKEFTKVDQPKIVEKEEDFYNPAFNLLMDYTLKIISRKDSDWVEKNELMLYDFLKEYATSSAIDRQTRLDEYAVIPNHYYKLCLKKDLVTNVNINEQLATFYQNVIKRDLHEKWVHESFKTLFTYKEQNATDVANEIQNKLDKDNYQDTIVLDIIELAENEPIDNWRTLFKVIYSQRESIRYKLGTPEERKAINRMMKKKDPALLELMADVADRENAKELIYNVNAVITQMEHDAYIKMLGAYSEGNIQNYLSEALVEKGIVVANQQGGQDFILSKEGYRDYYVEVKSRWESDQSVEMSSTQFKRAVDSPERYALISVNMYNFDRKRAENNESVSLNEIYSNIKCLDNIGYLEKDLQKRTDEAFRGSENDIRLNGSYSVRVPQSVFDAYPLDFNGLVNKIIKFFS